VSLLLHKVKEVQSEEKQPLVQMLLSAVVAVEVIQKTPLLHGPVEVEQQFGPQATQLLHEPERLPLPGEALRVEMLLINLPVVVVDRVARV
jgi:hypothetical protein